MKEFIQVYLTCIVCGGLSFIILLPVFHLIFKDSPRIRKVLDDETRQSHKIL